ncbi:MAG: PIG-L family deacetylase [Phycisphaera sp.]|nr:PIG-L family deacetylase [Phycisphaera sp.]
MGHTPDDSPRLLVLGAHPDDADYHAGGLVSIYRQRGRAVRMVSVTDGSSGHHKKSGDELATIRKAEAKAAGDVVGAEYHVWDYPDGRLEPSLELRERIIAEIRTFKPDLVLTHRPNDYHPDHRAVGQAVQDASYMVTVPPIVPNVPALRRDPVVAYMPDLFTKPCPLQPDVLIDVTPHLGDIIKMLACHVSQVFEWLPYNEGVLDEVPHDHDGRLAWLLGWYLGHIDPYLWVHRNAIIDRYGSVVGVRAVEVFEISEYAAGLRDEDHPRLFPDARLDD